MVSREFVKMWAQTEKTSVTTTCISAFILSKSMSMDKRVFFVSLQSDPPNTLKKIENNLKTIWCILPSSVLPDVLTEISHTHHTLSGKADEGQIYWST